MILGLKMDSGNKLKIVDSVGEIYIRSISYSGKSIFGIPT